MKTVIVFLVLLVSVYCHPVKRSVSSSESSEEVVRPSRLLLKSTPFLHKNSPAQTILAGSDESSDSSDEAQSDTASEDSADTEENDTESDESEESETTTEPPIIFETTPEPPIIFETTPELPVTDSGRGDNLGYPSDYKKSIIYVESNKMDQGPSPYKYYEMEKAVEGKGLVSKKMSTYDFKDGNDIEKNVKVYKALQAHDEDEGEDASTPEVESQGLDSAAEVPILQHADLEPETATVESESASTGESNSTSTSEEEEEESNSSQSSEETTATPGDSSQSSESQEGDYSEAPVIITAK